MSRTNVDDARLYGCSLGPKTSLGIEGPITAGRAILATEEPMIILNSGGALTFQLPPSDPSVAGAAKRGQIFVFTNENAAGTLVLQTSASGAFAPAIAGAAGNSHPRNVHGKRDSQPWLDYLVGE